jgi:hypothetical protein
VPFLDSVTVENPTFRQALEHHALDDHAWNEMIYLMQSMHQQLNVHVKLMPNQDHDSSLERKTLTIQF